MANPASIALLLTLTVVFAHAQIRFPDSVWDFEDYRHHPCNRICEANTPARVCHYKWTLETYGAMSTACYDCPYNVTDCHRPDCVSAGGVHRGVMVVNRMLPGPSIEVCEGDTIEVEVHNDLQNSEGSSIHWHGLLQRGTPYMDGVARLTQCAITPGGTFTYRFQADDPGTHLYHGHAGMQRADGLFGAIVVRQTPNLDPHYLLYDHDLSEHVITVTDWFEDITLSRYVSHHHDTGDNKPAMMLINGLGVHQEYTRDNMTYNTPRAEFKVEGGKRYRFRVISAGILYCPIQISVDGHTMTVITSDGSPFEPFVVESFNIFAGERFDFVLHADKVNTTNYWIRARGMGDCQRKQSHQLAVLKYQGVDDSTDPPGETGWEASFREGKTLNPWNTQGSDQQVEITRMRSLANDDASMTQTPDKQFWFAMDFNQVSDSFKYNKPPRYPMQMVPRGNRVYSPQMNWISSALPVSPPLSQFNDVPASEYCNEFTVQKDCTREWCHCIHLVEAKLGDLVEMIVVDQGKPFAANHPMHIHGFKFRTVGIGKVGDTITMAEIKAMDARGELNRTTSGAPLKDTVTVPDGGYTIMRFWADNPGLWFFHCHIEYHADLGMGVVIKVGEPSEWPAVPQHFPKCGNYHFGNSDNDDHNTDGSHTDDHTHDNDHDHSSDNDQQQQQQPITVQCVVQNTSAGLKIESMSYTGILLVSLALFLFSAKSGQC